MVKKFRFLNDHISKTKNHKNLKMDFTFVSKHCSAFYTKKNENGSFWGGGGVCMSLEKPGGHQNRYFLRLIWRSGNLIKNMTGSNNFLKFIIKYNFIQIQFSEFHLVQNHHFFSIENGKFTVAKPVKSFKPLHVTAIWFRI